MHIEFSHGLSQSKARAKINQALNQSRAQIMTQAKILEERWAGDTLHFVVEIQGKKVTGSLDITESNYVLDATLPLMWRLFERKIENEIKKQMEHLPGR